MSDKGRRRGGVDGRSGEIGGRGYVAEHPAAISISTKIEHEQLPHLDQDFFDPNDATP